MKPRNSTTRRKFIQNSAAMLAGGSLHTPTVDNGEIQSGLKSQAGSGGITVSLDGAWQVADSVLADEIPLTFEHEGPVPGMANLAVPPFPDVDAYISREVLMDRRAFKIQPESELAKMVPGPRQRRNYFWYQRTFRSPSKTEVAILKINKAQFGTAVWLNGKKIGEHYSCFTAGHFNVTAAMNWEGDNHLVIRIGAHPGAVPPWVPSGSDFEKNKWTPGIYDRVSLHLANNPIIETLQVAPRLDPPGIVVQTQIMNYGGACSLVLTYQVRTWKVQRLVAEPPPQSLHLGAGESKIVTETIALPNAQLWTPENPFLYELETRTGGDSVSTRFGVRVFRFDSATKRAYLNGKIYFMRGSNITLHRFFDDPQCRSLPWNEAWLRKLLIDIPKRMHWNSFRFCIGPVPDHWLDLADEAGLLIQYEYFVWTAYTDFYKEWSKEELIREYQEWMRDNWNHPSVAIWDATNESVADIFGDEIIPAVRSRDLSHRPWENSYNLPDDPNDPVESHLYLFATGHKPPYFEMANLEKMTSGLPEVGSWPVTGHARILNEYGWLWLTRDGNPSPVSQPVYDRLLGPQATPAQRLELDAYLLAGLTEFWRAYRHFAGVLHFVYLSSNYPGVYTADHFQDIEKLILEPHFEDYVGEAFKPLGVYINFWRPTLEAGSQRRFMVMMVNDAYASANGNLALAWEGEDGREVVRREVPFAIPGLGQQTYKVDLAIPNAPGNYMLKAIASCTGKDFPAPTVSRRKVSLGAKAA